MSGFSAAWLALREAADHRARNAKISDALQAHFALRETLNIVDLGAGTGSNLRATASLLPAHQNWTLVDNDQTLLAAAREALSSWADHTEQQDEDLILKKDHKTLKVSFKTADLANNLEAAIGEAPDLVTASALFDLFSPATMRQVTKLVTKAKAAFYTVLTYNGLQQWAPRHPNDNALVAAYHHHQRRNKGLGEAAGPTAPQILFDQYQASGYYVQEGSSPWKLTAARDQDLIDELKRGYVSAVLETGRVAENDVLKWNARALTGATVGHTDTLALPGTSTFHDDEDFDDDNYDQ